MAREHFTSNLKCANCGWVGVAHTSEASGYSYWRDNETRIDSVSEGFVVRSPSTGNAKVGIDREQCNVSAY